MNIFQKLYDEGQNFCIQSFRNDGFIIRLGDAINGYSHQVHVTKWKQVPGALKKLYERKKKKLI